MIANGTLQGLEGRLCRYVRTREKRFYIRVLYAIHRFFSASLLTMTPQEQHKKYRRIHVNSKFFQKEVTVRIARENKRSVWVELGLGLANIKKSRIIEVI